MRDKLWALPILVMCSAEIATTQQAWIYAFSVGLGTGVLVAIFRDTNDGETVAS